MDEITQDDLVEAYWTYQRLARGSREDRLRVDDYFWAFNHVNDLVADDPPAAVHVMDTLLASPNAEKSAIASGPLEDLLVLHPSWCAEHLTTKCRQDPLWSELVRAAWVEDVTAAKLGDLSVFLKHDRRPDR